MEQRIEGACPFEIIVFDFIDVALFSYATNTPLCIKKSMTYKTIFLYSEQPNFYLKQREKNSIHLFDEHEIVDLER